MSISSEEKSGIKVNEFNIERVPRRKAKKNKKTLKIIAPEFWGDNNSITLTYVMVSNSVASRDYSSYNLYWE